MMKKSKVQIKKKQQETIMIESRKQCARTLKAIHFSPIPTGLAEILICGTDPATGALLLPREYDWVPPLVHSLLQSNIRTLIALLCYVIKRLGSFFFLFFFYSFLNLNLIYIKAADAMIKFSIATVDDHLLSILQSRPIYE